MTLRYVMLTVVVIVVALAAGFVVHKTDGHEEYQSSCQFQLALPSTATQPSSDILVFNRRQAVDELEQAGLGPVFTNAAKTSGISAGELSVDSSVGVASDSSFNLTTSTRDPALAVRMANALCTAYVGELRTLMGSSVNSEASGLRDEIDNLEGQLDASVHKYGIHTTGAVNVNQVALENAISRARQYLTFTISQPPYAISVLAPAIGWTSRSTKPSASKSLIVAAAAGLLLSFLLILAVESLRRRPLEEG
jgi:hypothetical protein